MGVLVGLGVGMGLLLVWSAFALPRADPAARQDAAPDGRLRRLLTGAGLADVAVPGFVALCLGCGLVVAVVVQGVSSTPPVAVAFGAMASYLPIAIVTARARRRLRELAEVWPEAIDNLASAVRAGLSLPDALAGLATRGPEPLRAAFDAFALDYQVTGRFGESLDRLKDRLADPVGDRVVEGLRIAREVGGGELGRLLRNLSGYLRDDLRTRSELESRQAWAVNVARWIMGVHQGEEYGGRMSLAGTGSRRRYSTGLDATLWNEPERREMSVAAASMSTACRGTDRLGEAGLSVVAPNVAQAVRRGDASTSVGVTQDGP